MYWCSRRVCVFVLSVCVTVVLMRGKGLRKRRAALVFSGYVAGARVGELLCAGFDGRDSPGSVGRAS